MHEEDDCPLGASSRRTVRETERIATERGQGPYLVRQRTRPTTIYVSRGIHGWVLWPIFLGSCLEIEEHQGSPRRPCRYPFRRSSSRPMPLALTAA
jgi:hypothetical protein